MEVQGKVKMVGETQTFGSNGFRKRELVVTTEEQYPQMIYDTGEDLKYKIKQIF